MDNTTLTHELESWSEIHNAKYKFDPSEEVHELSWPGSSNNVGYIDVYRHPERTDVVVVQHGMFNGTTNARQQGGVTRWFCGDPSALHSNLDDLKLAIDSMSVVQPKIERLSYTPTVDIGRVHDFKLR